MKKIITAMLLVLSAAAFADGKQVLEDTCMACHVVDGKGGEKKAAPPMYAVWHHYHQAYKDRESFVAAVSSWVLQPNKENTQMMGAIKKFGLMEKTELNEAEARSVAEYLYETSFDTPNMYLQHYRQGHEQKKSATMGDKTVMEQHAPEHERAQH